MSRQSIRPHSRFRPVRKRDALPAEDTTNTPGNAMHKSIFAALGLCMTATVAYGSFTRTPT